MFARISLIVLALGLSQLALAADIDYLSWSCTFEHHSGGMGFGFKPSEGSAQVDVPSAQGTYVARCEMISREENALRARCSLSEIRDGHRRVFTQKVFDAAGSEEVLLETDQAPSLRLRCLANS